MCVAVSLSFVIQLMLCPRKEQVHDEGTKATFQESDSSGKAVQGPRADVTSAVHWTRMCHTSSLVTVSCSGLRIAGISFAHPFSLSSPLRRTSEIYNALLDLFPCCCLDTPTCLLRAKASSTATWTMAAAS